MSVNYLYFVITNYIICIHFFLLKIAQTIRGLSFFWVTIQNVLQLIQFSIQNHPQS